MKIKRRSPERGDRYIHLIISILVIIIVLVFTSIKANNAEEDHLPIESSKSTKATSVQTTDMITTATTKIETTHTTTKSTTKTAPTTKRTTTKPSTKKAVNKKETTSINEGSDTTYYSATCFKKMGVIYWGKYKWTWYSQKALPGKGLKIPGRHVDDNGYVCDNSGYICLASCDIPKGTVINTPFGKQGKIYDYCPRSGTIDVYVNF